MPKLDIDIRESTSADRAAIERLYPAAFPDEDLVPLVGALLDQGHGVLSLVAMDGATLAGHGAFTVSSIGDRADQAALLGPLAVAPDHQKQGIGGALIREGARRLKTTGVAHVFVLGDPAYYGRFGFEPGHGVAPPYPLPEEWADAWRVLRLGDAAAPDGETLSVPGPWQDPALWSG